MAAGPLRLVPFLALVCALAAGTTRLGAQSVVVDEGAFAITLNGRAAGTERFTIRRAGVGDDAIVIANAVVQLNAGGGVTELRPLLEATPLDDASANYQLKVSGEESAEISVRLAGRRYVSRLHTEVGEEEREYLARPGRGRGSRPSSPGCDGRSSSPCPRRRRRRCGWAPSGSRPGRSPFPPATTCATSGSTPRVGFFAWRSPPQGT